MKHEQDIFIRPRAVEDPYQLEGDCIAGVSVDRVIHVENKLIASGRGVYTLATYEGVKQDEPVRLVVYDVEDGGGADRHPLYPKHKGKTLQERLFDKIHLHKFGHPANLSQFVDSSLIPEVYDVGETTIQVTGYRPTPEEYFDQVFNKSDERPIRTYDKRLLYLVSEPFKDDIIYPMEIDEALDFYIHLTKELKSIHQQGVYHANINPKTIVGTKKEPRLINFETGNNSDGGESIQTLPFTSDGKLSLKYLSPEIIEHGPSHLTAASDVYSLGHCLFTSIVGDHAIHHGKMTDIVKHIMYGLPRKPWPESLLSEKGFIGVTTAYQQATRNVPGQRCSIDAFIRYLELARMDRQGELSL